MGTGIALQTHPPVPYPGYTPPLLLLGPASAALGYATEEYGRGAQIRRPTLFSEAFLRVQRYYRGL